MYGPFITVLFHMWFLRWRDLKF